MENKPKFKPNPELRLMDQVRQVLRYHHHSYRNEGDPSSDGKSDIWGQSAPYGVLFYVSKGYPSRE
jgi:hypothetical protein